MCRAGRSKLPVHVLDDDPVGQPDAERQPPAERKGDSERLLREGGRMPRIGRHYRGAKLDSGHLAAGHR
jgi:hypothetical protein